MNYTNLADEGQRVNADKVTTCPVTVLQHIFTLRDDAEIKANTFAGAFHDAALYSSPVFLSTNA